MSKKRKGKRELMREAFRDFIEEFADKDILKDLGSIDLEDEEKEEGKEMENTCGCNVKEDLGSIDLEDKEKEEGEEMENTCRCNVKKDEDCICYFYNKKRASELERKLGKEKFRKKQLVDELTQILIEYDCG